MKTYEQAYKQAHDMALAGLMFNPNWENDESLAHAYENGYEDGAEARAQYIEEFGAL